MVFATCSSVSSSGVGSNCYINIAYNIQLPLCASTTDSGLRNGKRVCRPPEQLCTADPDFRFDLSERSDNDVSNVHHHLHTRHALIQPCQAFVRIPLVDIFPSNSPSLLVMDTTQSPALPVPLKLGDVNQDGFPDILAIIVTGSGSQASRTPQLAVSEACGSGVAGCGRTGKGRRGWSLVKKGIDPLKGIRDARSVAFFDMDEDVSQHKHTNVYPC